MMIVVIVTIVTSGVHAPRDSGNREAGEAVLMLTSTVTERVLSECNECNDSNICILLKLVSLQPSKSPCDVSDKLISNHIYCGSGYDCDGEENIRNTHAAKTRSGEAAVIAVTRLLHGRNGGGHYWEHTRRETAKR